MRLSGLLLAAVLASSLAIPACADPVAPSTQDEKTAFTVAALLRREHLSRHPLDDEIASRALNLYLKSLDPMKVYFLQSDIDAFNRQGTQIDDQLKRGKIDLGYTVFQTFLRRIDERVKLVDEFLAMQHDFTVDEEIVVDPDVAEYAKNEAEARDKWRKRIKYDLLTLKADDTVGQEAIDKLTRRYHSFAKRMHQTSGDELLEMYLTSVTTAYDPHTTYMSPSTLENFDISMRLELEGIGAALQSEDGYTIVSKIIPGGAAAKHGQLKPQDKIVGVGQGKDGAIQDVVDMKLDDVVALIRGKRGTTVRLEVIPLDSQERKILEIVRERVELKDSEAQAKVFEEGQQADGSPYKIGVINLPSFYMDMEGARQGLAEFKSTTRDVRRILEGFNQQGVDAVVLDLRFNGGGSLQEAINLTGLFIDQGPVVQVKDADGQVLPYNDLESGAVWNGPLVVVINKFSASASEILAGAIQDYRRGLVIGDHATHGKGTVQSLMDLSQRLFGFTRGPELGALKITMQQFYRPNGESTQKRGVLSDVELPSLTTHLDVGEADLEYPVEFDRIEAMRYQPANRVDKTIVDRLKYQSVQRREASEDFQKVAKRIDLYLKQKGRKTVTLNEEKFMAEREALTAEKEEQKKLEELNNLSESGIKRDYYLNEAIAITMDYLQMTLVAQAR